jgi:UDP-N-acetylglucosamine 4,6-dehydratase/5-epimerase
MSLEDAVDLVIYAYQYSLSGDIYVQKSPASTILDLANAIKEIFKADNPINIIGTRHGEKLYETLLTREEIGKAEDLGNYYRIVPDDRDLNYSKYFTEGEKKVSYLEDYNSHNTKRLTVEEVIEKLLTLDYIKSELGCESL